MHVRLRAGVSFAVIVIAQPAGAQNTPTPVRSDTAVRATRADSLRANKVVTATRVPNGSMRPDGVLTESVWASIPATTDFLQKQPVEGGVPTDQLEIRMAYDDDALYVGTR